MFRLAKPIFPQGKETELNCFATFTCRVDSLRESVLRITAASFYRLCVNGTFVAFGPARTAEGYARVDSIPLDAYGQEGGNELRIEVAGYHCRSLSTVFQPSFLCAELVRGEQVLACTGRDFTAYLSPARVQKVERYSMQRHFSEVWDLREDDPWTPADRQVPVAIAQHELTFLDRVAAYPAYEDVSLSQAVSRGTLVFDESLPYRQDYYSAPKPSERWGIFPREEVDFHSFEWIQRHRQDKTDGASSLPLVLGEHEYAIFDFSNIECGFLMLSALAESDADVIIGFSENSTPDHFEKTNIHAHNTVEVLLGKGKETDFLSFEPYTARYAIVAVCSGSITLKTFGIKGFAYETASVKTPALVRDPVLQSIYRAAVRTFAHNAVDIYTDCPSRERAGWLCDSYFTGKVEHFLYGKCPVEDAFLENYRLYRGNGELPEGAIPMCFPADVLDDGRFIPQWTMWYILETADWLRHRNRTVDKSVCADSVRGLLKFYARYENSDGLLERLPSWNFVEWSAANNWTMDVNYPTNFLYAEVLDAAAFLLEDESYAARAEQVRRKAVEQSFNGRVFLDHAVRGENGELVRLNDCSEAGQYYAILFGGIDLNEPRYAELKRLVTRVFGATRREPLPEIEPINAFIGVYLRLEALLKLKEYRLVLADIADFFGDMERVTGTLWEYREGKGSRDHGFASYALVAMVKALEGLQ